MKRTLLIFLLLSTSFQVMAGDRAGKEIYNYYCYQCHGYAGDAKTLASTFLFPPPRDFTTTSPHELDLETMITAVREGKKETGMVSFTRVLSEQEMFNVVTFVRKQFMTKQPLKQSYHSSVNGWANNQTYTPAYPFANGDIPLDRPWQELSEPQKRGKEIFMSACISCHDRANVSEEGNIWEHQAISFPRSSKYDPDRDLKFDATTSATNFLLHEIPTAVALSKKESTGEHLFQQNCAFCHGMDATGKNWIGSFMIPKAADLTHSPLVLSGNNDALQHVISNGVVNSSMPAWKDVLSTSQIDAIIVYLKKISQDNNPETNGKPDTGLSSPAKVAELNWRKTQPPEATPTME